MNNELKATSTDFAHESHNAPLIMIIDNDQSICASLSSQLEHLGYQTTSIQTNGDVASQISHNPPKAIFIDINFKNAAGTGTDIIHNLRNKDEIQCPVIYLSAIDDLNCRLTGVRNGGTAFLSKSFSLSELKNTLDTVIPLHKNSSFKVLIIDDDKSMNAYCTAILENALIKVYCLESADDLFTYIKNFDPDVVLLDMYMPTINGIEMSAVIRQHQSFSSIPIVIMSGETDINKQFVMRSMGADDFILKPFKPHHLVDTVLNRIQRSRQTKNLINSDALTGLMLFPKIKDQIINLLDSCVRYKFEFSIAFLDLDHFKKVNDTYGHLVGDQILRDFAEFLVTRVRRSDIVTRYGGEEFAVIFPYTSGENSILALNSIRDSYSNTIQKANNVEFKVTFSAGISNIKNYQNLESLLAAADQALYKAKASGGNCINLAD